MLAARLDALLAHEVSVHLLTYFNGAAQGLTVFRTGLAQYEGVQEGLGVFAEWAVGGLTAARLRLLAGRVVAVDAMLRRRRVHRRLPDAGRRHGLPRAPAFDIAARVFRSGGFAKDADLPARASEAWSTWSRRARRSTPFWLGKIAPGHVRRSRNCCSAGWSSRRSSPPNSSSATTSAARIERLGGGRRFQREFSTWSD